MAADDFVPAQLLAPEVARTEEQIERTREQVAMSVMALRHEVARRVNWREWIRARPAVFLGGAFVLGFWLGRRNKTG